MSNRGFLVQCERADERDFGTEHVVEFRLRPWDERSNDLRPLVNAGSMTLVARTFNDSAMRDEFAPGAKYIVRFEEVKE